MPRSAFGGLGHSAVTELHSVAGESKKTAGEIRPPAAISHVFGVSLSNRSNRPASWAGWYHHLLGHHLANLYLHFLFHLVRHADRTIHGFLGRYALVTGHITRFGA